MTARSEVSLRWLLAATMTGNTPAEIADSQSQASIAWFTPEAFSEHGIELSAPKGYAQADAVRLFPKNSVLAVGIASIGKVAVAANDCSGNQQINCLVPGPKLDSRYLAYALKNQAEKMRADAGVSTLPILNQDKMKALRVPFVELRDQTAIANYLDVKTAAIDALIAKKKLLIDELTKYQEAVIVEAVTGQSMTANYKDADKARTLHPWFGPMPAGFHLSKLKHAFSRIASGGTPDTSNDNNWADESGTPWVAIADMSSTWLVTRTAKRLTDAGIQEKRLAVFPSGTLLYSMYASVGHVAQLEVSAAINQALLALTPKTEMDARFAFWQLVAMKEFVSIAARTGTQDNLNAETVKNFPFVVPPLAVQTALANHLDKTTAAIEAAIENVSNAIQLLRSYRASIIYEAVTSKPKLPG
jgi:type I restriction enzyme S subunit